MWLRYLKPKRRPAARKAPVTTAACSRSLQVSFMWLLARRAYFPAACAPYMHALKTRPPTSAQATRLAGAAVSLTGPTQPPATLLPLLLCRADVRADPLGLQGVHIGLERRPPAAAVLHRPSGSAPQAHQPQLGLQGQARMDGRVSSSSRWQDGHGRLPCRPAGAVSHLGGGGMAVDDWALVLLATAA